jgi:hypothetical protein
MAKAENILTSSKVKEIYREMINKAFEDMKHTKVDENNTITLYHGTSSHYLNEILTYGLRTRGETGNNNWEKCSSFENLIYLTRKWHYFFAYNTTMELFETKGIESYPCYLEFKVPTDLLVADEDFINTKFFSNIVNKKHSLEFSWEDSLAQYGTATYLGNIPRKYLVSFTIISDDDFIEKYIENPKSDYMLDYQQLKRGNGKGKRVKLSDMLKRESKSVQNATWYLKDYPDDVLVKDFYFDENTNSIKCIFTKGRSY